MSSKNAIIFAFWGLSGLVLGHIGIFKVNSSREDLDPRHYQCMVYEFLSQDHLDFIFIRVTIDTLCEILLGIKEGAVSHVWIALSKWGSFVYNLIINWMDIFFPFKNVLVIYFDWISLGWDLRKVWITAVFRQLTPKFNFNIHEMTGWVSKFRLMGIVFASEVYEQRLILQIVSNG